MSIIRDLQSFEVGKFVATAGKFRPHKDTEYVILPSAQILFQNSQPLHILTYFTFIRKQFRCIR